MDERQALARLRRGDISGLETLVQVYQVKAVRTAYLIIRDRAAAEDIVQGAFLRISERIHQFDPQRPFEPWFLRIVINDAVKAAQRRQRQVSIDADLGESELTLADVLIDPTPDPADEFERQEIQQAVWDAMEQLTPKQRAVAVMRYYLGYGESELAETLTIPLGTVKWRLHSARQRLQKLLTPVWNESGWAMDERLITQALQDKARKDIPEDMDMFPEIQAQLGRVSRRAVRSRSSWLLIAIVVMLTASIVAYGAARLLQTVWLDPGLTGASEADLITVLNLEQTIDGVTVVIDYAYADSNRLSIAYHMAGEAPNSIDYRFSSEKIIDSQGHEFTGPMFGGGGGGGGGSSDSAMHSYSQSSQGSYDLSRLENLPDELDMRIEIGVDRLIYPTATPVPVENPVPSEPLRSEPIGPFVFEFKLPFIHGQAVEPQQSVSANDLTLTLENMLITPSMTRGTLCFDPPEMADRYFPLVHLTIEGEAVEIEEQQSFEPGQEATGCDILRIPDSLYDRSGKWVLTIDRLGAYLPVSTTSGSDGTTQDYTIMGDAEFLARARAKLEPGLATYGIELSEADGELTFSFPLADDLDLRAVNELVAEATREYLPGPWVFTFEVPPAS